MRPASTSHVIAPTPIAGTAGSPGAVNSATATTAPASATRAVSRHGRPYRTRAHPRVNHHRPACAAGGSWSCAQRRRVSRRHDEISRGPPSPAGPRHAAPADRPAAARAPAPGSIAVIRSAIRASVAGSVTNGGSP
jgi:hypothetical protein